MEKLLQFQNYVVYRKKDGDLVDQDGAPLNRTPYARIRSWVNANYTFGYEENSEPQNDFLFQRISFLGEDKKPRIFGVSQQGSGNIPWQYVMAVYEKSDLLPGILKRNRPMWGGHSEEEESCYSLERIDCRIYPIEADKLGRITRTTVASGEKTHGGWIYNAFDLKIAYEGKTIKPKTVRLLPPSWHIIARKWPSAHGCKGREINAVMHEVLAKFGIDSTQIILPKRLMLKTEESSR
ncbi:MAG: hypothetical protein II942_02735 [Alphaproteobacteria bacterium]|nr:hypothetical protein [Alphaproteobacteria bacterium]